MYVVFYRFKGGKWRCNIIPHKLKKDADAAARAITEQHPGQEVKTAVTWAEII